MSDCKYASSSKCGESVTHSKASEEGKWIGITISLWLLVLFLFWVVRTCTQPVRRQRLIHKLSCCFKKLGWDEQQPSGTNVGNVAGNGTAGIQTSGSAVCLNGLQQRESVISQHPPPSYQDAILLTSYRSGTRPSKSPDTFGPDEGDNAGDDEDDDDCFEEDDDKEKNSRNTAHGAMFSNGARHGRLHTRRLRNSVTSLSITLATIEEDANETKHSSQPELHIPRVNVGNYPRSKSVPSKLFTMASPTPAFYLPEDDDVASSESSVVDFDTHI